MVTKLPIDPAPSAPVALKNIIDQLLDIQEAGIYSNDIPEALGTLIQKAKQQIQHACTTQTSIVNVFSQ